MQLATLVFVSLSLSIQYFTQKYKLDDYEKTLRELEPELGVPRIRTYDFIVIGGGSGGGTVAGRLSEHFSVLLLEAGGTPIPQAEVPAFIYPVGYAPDINYFFRTLPSPDGGGVFGTSFGKMLGGSGSHNDMVHNRGNPRDFDTWANITGDPSWGYDAVLPYFKKYEDFIGVLFDEGTEDAYGHGGPLQVDTYLNPMVTAWSEAARELGYDVADPNAHQRESFTALNVMIGAGKRVSTYTGFIKPLEERRASNLTVLRYSDVDEILIDESKRAYGVAYNRHGLTQRAHASKEVILSAGAFRSPLLLMKSGVGPAGVLAEAGIPVKVERPGVGRNLGEHATVGVGPIYINDSSLVCRLWDGDEAELERYHETGGGVLGENCDGPQAFLVSSRAKAEGQQDWPDIQISLNLKWGDLAPTPEGQEDIVFIFVTNVRTRQRGSVSLNGTAWRLGERDDQRLALIDVQLLSDPSDMDVLVDGIKASLSVFENTTVFQRVGARYPASPHSACLDFWYRSDEYWRCVVGRSAGISNHWVGTNSMGRAEDPSAVVDSKLKVIGVEGLRVIDASVMPVTPNANPNAPTLMVAEKGADEILRAHGILT